MKTLKLTKIKPELTDFQFIIDKIKQNETLEELYITITNEDEIKAFENAFENMEGINVTRILAPVVNTTVGFRGFRFSRLSSASPIPSPSAPPSPPSAPPSPPSIPQPSPSGSETKKIPCILM